MELYQQIFLNAIEKTDRKLFVPGFTIDAEKLFRWSATKPSGKSRKLSRMRPWTTRNAL